MREKHGWYIAPERALWVPLMLPTPRMLPTETAPGAMQHDNATDFRVTTNRFVPKLILALALVLVATVGVVVFGLVTHKPAPRTWTRPMPAPSAKAFETGGVPLHEPAIDQALAQPLTDLVVQAGRARTGDTTFVTTLAKLEATKLGALGAHPKLAAAWRQAFEAVGTAVAAAQLGVTQHDRDTYREAIKDLTDAFAAEGLGYFLEGRFRNGFAYLQAYRVDEVVFVKVQGQPRRVLTISRLDHLDTSYNVLGMQNESVGDPVLHTERIAEYVATSELPVFADKAEYPIADTLWQATPEAKALAREIANTLRREYAAALGPDMPAAIQSAKLLVERGAIIEQWRNHLEKHHIYFTATDSLFVPVDLLTALADDVPHYQLERVEAIDEELAELEGPRIHARVHDLVTATVRHHEAQHGFDYDRETELRYPPELIALLGASTHDSEGNPRALVRSARDEMSAFLSEIINNPTTPHSTLWHLGQETFNRNSAGNSYFYAGIVVIEGLAKQLGVDTGGPTFAHGLDRVRLAKIASQIAALPDDKLRDTATTLWLQLYGEPPTKIADAAETTNGPSR